MMVTLNGDIDDNVEPPIVNANDASFLQQQDSKELPKHV